MRATDLTLGILVLLGGIAIYVSAMGFEVIPGQSYGAGTMPRAIAFATIGVGLFIAGKALMAGDRSLGFELRDWVRSGRALFRAGTALVLIVVYIVAAPFVGFTPAALFVLLAGMLVLGTRPLPAIAISIVATIAIQQSFGRLLLVPLPRSDLFSFLW
ncbi:tripartite tricarboxylate transporter TctB family protein [Palleronia aestuarii]|uniref:Tripartite tricarboxylate transporter TctB family protein n=1 Tax=Palleronia aestuarii TaxID=568105 RepID=A0A2W7NET1_9RHOB|nr:tripartite tricarboxylate transporter TctB family protein [Palleronia aestuarii]PZX15234.1 tripartite tricarboxylate transporter TctB family protein [Palleronia aestuarii]